MRGLLWRLSGRLRMPVGGLRARWGLRGLCVSVRHDDRRLYEHLPVHPVELHGELQRRLRRLLQQLPGPTGELQLVVQQHDELLHGELPGKPLVHVELQRTAVELHVRLFLYDQSMHVELQRPTQRLPVELLRGLLGLPVAVLPRGRPVSVRLLLRRERVARATRGRKRRHRSDPG